MRRSLLIVSGMTMVHLYPRAAHTMARPMPVLPLVGSRMMVSGLIDPARSAASIIDRPIRSFTLCEGFWNSSLASTSATHPCVSRLMRTSGVLPISSVTLWAILMSFLLVLVLGTLHYPRHRGGGTSTAWL